MTEADRIRDGLTDIQRKVLRDDLPLALGPDGCLPAWGPSGQTIRQLANKDLIVMRRGRWERTARGEHVCASETT